jgi:hypothetical protein
MAVPAGIAFAALSVSLGNRRHGLVFPHVSSPAIPAFPVVAGSKHA